MPALSSPASDHLRTLIAEGEHLLGQWPSCDKMLDDLSATVLIAQMIPKGFDVPMELAESCIARMRIAVETGEYPDELLKQARAAGAR